MPAADNSDDVLSPDPVIQVSCSRCGLTAAGPPLTWMREFDARRGPRWICAECSRTHLRAIEGKLDQAWW